MKTTLFFLVLALFLGQRSSAQANPSVSEAHKHSDSAERLAFNVPFRGDDPEAKGPRGVEAAQPIVQSGHAAAITAMAFSPRSTLLATGSVDGTVKLWLGQSGQLLRSFSVSTFWVDSLAFSPDGCILAAGSGDHKIYLWNLDLGTQLTPLDPHAGAVKALGFSADGTLLASGTTGVGTNPRSPVATVWEVSSWHKLFQFKAGSEVHDVAFVPGATALAIASGKQ